ncbi:MAG: hypothetical protein JSV85_05965 [Candidatus Bathyarchaeota archaeon]|nr:MAG: hypothetical protein JSV85_05965 [Candidatus Bathyarchaeota archaeon]
MFRKLVSLNEAERILRQNFSPQPVGVEMAPLSEACNRVLVKDALSPINVPSFDKSTVDGYAAKATDTFGADEDQPIVLKLCGRVTTGVPPRVVVENGTLVEIVTGAPLPKGADAVVMLEYAIRKQNRVFVHRPVSKGENIMKAGSDIKKGEIVQRAGRVLSSRGIGVLAALGLAQVEVYKRPKVAVLSTGGEIVEPGNTLPPMRVYDINAHALSAAVLECGGEPINLGIVQDDVHQLEVALKKALDLADVVITSGGVSAGPKDFLPQVLDMLGKPGLIVHGIAVKPGKPTTIAVVDERLVFSLPGHPTSSLLMFLLIVRPILCQMSGVQRSAPLTLKAAAATKMFPARGRRTFVMVTLACNKSGRLLASPVPLGLSGAITTLANADGFVEIGEDKQFFNAGEEVTVYLFESRDGFWKGVAETRVY